ncbi:hypothetical protein COT48_02695 [Candidatus Woesearchaeota archaeon CG08_land_8_20_14_0_20_47_9]|nr:MAG: hypothetical protein AUJ69_00250 [Candidatus Woesearchaeota archaeon CG1_02_47_18]PIO03996.1 MAG: hypothetical protein COT48_02695 [Candidatus Woesearchaeota archaeon CG08_land_8_20_14_0_20_47_9]HII29746.1 MFS transporter [Candidatus Woesearchaeota archaeon]
MKSLADEVKKRKVSGESSREISLALGEQGFLQADISSAISESAGADSEKRKRERIENHFFMIKEFYDRIGFGLASQQFINILLMQIASSYFIVGLFNALKAFLEVVMAFFMNSYMRLRRVPVRSIGLAGILFGFSLIIVASASMFKSLPLFLLGMAVATISVVSYGEPYQRLLSSRIKKERRSYALKKIAYFGIITTAVSLFIGGRIMDAFPESGEVVSLSLFGNPLSFRLYGYLIAFDMAAILFILSGYALSFIRDQGQSDEHGGILSELGRGFKESFENIRAVTSKRILLLLLVTGAVMGSLQTLVNSFYGIFIFRAFFRTGFGGFTNVAFIFIMALLASLLGPKISKMNADKYGKFPMLVFGTLLMAITPLTYYYNPTMFAIAEATLLGVIGSVIAGVAQNLLLIDLAGERERRVFFSTLSILVVVPQLVIVPLGAYLADIYSLSLVFLGAGIAMASMTPLYLGVIVLHKKEKI